MTPALAGHEAAQVTLAAELLDAEIDESIELLRIEKGSLEILGGEDCEREDRERAQKESIRRRFAEAACRVCAQRGAQLVQLRRIQALLAINPGLDCLVGNIIAQLWIGRCEQRCRLEREWQCRLALRQPEAGTAEPNPERPVVHRALRISAGVRGHQRQTCKQEDGHCTTSRS